MKCKKKYFKMTLKFTLTVLLSLSVHFGVATSRELPPLKEITQEVHTEFKRFQIHNLNIEIADYELGGLLKSHKEKWFVMDAFPLGSGDLRMSGVNLQESHQVVLSKYTLEKVEGDEKFGFLFHELLGSKGLDDENYQLSTLVTVLLSPSYKEILPELMGSIKAKLKSAQNFKGNRKYLLADGGTSVGGGGDSIAFSLKLRILKSILNSKGNPKEIWSTISELDRLNVVVDYQPRISSEVEVLSMNEVQKGYVISYLNWISNYEDYQKNVETWFLKLIDSESVQYE